MPLYTILLAMGNPTVHYFSLDIEGAEFPVLKTIPWDKVLLWWKWSRCKIMMSSGRHPRFGCWDTLGGSHLPWGQEGSDCLHGEGDAQDNEVEPWLKLRLAIVTSTGHIRAQTQIGRRWGRPTTCSSGTTSLLSKRRAGMPRRLWRRSWQKKISKSWPIMWQRSWRIYLTRGRWAWRQRQRGKICRCSKTMLIILYNSKGPLVNAFWKHKIDRKDILRVEMS